MNCLAPTLYIGLHWSEQVRVAPTIELTGGQESELTRLVEKVLGLDGLPRFVSA